MDTKEERWWINNPLIWKREIKRLADVFPSNNFKFEERDNILWLSGSITIDYERKKLVEFDFEVKFPTNYPFSIPWIFPKKRGKWVAKHQFISNRFCLNIRDKSWSTRLTSADLLLSLKTLLDANFTSIIDNSDTLDVFEERHPTIIDEINKTIDTTCFPSDHIFDTSKFGQVGIFTTSDPEKAQHIVSPYYKEIIGEIIADALKSNYFNIWGANSIICDKIFWFNVSEESHLSKILFTESIASIINKCEEIGLDNEIIDFLKSNGCKKFILIHKGSPVANIEISADGKVKKSGIYNAAWSDIGKRLPETIALRNKSVAIIGCGSGGSLIADQLVRSGLQKMILVDADILTIENISRHVCTIDQLGMKKIWALYNHLKKINPDVQIECIDINLKVISETIEKKIINSDILINATGENAPIINAFCWERKIPSIHSKVFPLGFGGEIIRVLPGITPCFECMNSLVSHTLKLKYGKVSEFPDFDIINYNKTIDGEVIETPSISIDANLTVLLSCKLILDVLLLTDYTKINDNINAILWGNKREWIFSDRFECVKIDTTGFKSHPMCFICNGLDAISKELE